jgi:integrase
MLQQSLAEAVAVASKKWQGTRARASQISQLMQALKTVLQVLNERHSSLSALELKDITTPIVQECVKHWQSQELSPSTINSRLSVLGVIGVKTDGCWVKNKLPPKWWLRPDESSRLLAHLRATPAPFPSAPPLADYIEFVSYTGLRVEEALRLTWRDVTLKVIKVDGVLRSQSEMTVPGTKTRRSHATFALGDMPSLILLKRKKEGGDNPFVFPIKCDHLHESWDKARAFLGEQDNPMATIKALRRTAARHLTASGMPTEMVRDCLRHSDIKTSRPPWAICTSWAATASTSSVGGSRSSWSKSDGRVLQVTNDFRPKHGDQRFEVSDSGTDFWHGDEILRHGSTTLEQRYSCEFLFGARCEET